MYLIVGLGNPETDYARTRHNMGFDTVNVIAEKYKIEMTRTKFNSNFRKWNNRKGKSNFSKTTNVYEFKRTSST